MILLMLPVVRAVAQEDSGRVTDEEPTSTVYLKDGSKRETSMLGKLRDGKISIDSEDGLGRMIFEIGRIEYIEFPIEIDQRRVDQLQAENKYGELAETIRAAIEPWLFYIDVPNNINRWAMRLLHSLYKDGQMQAALDLAERFERRSYSDQARREGRLYENLVLLQTKPEKGLDMAAQIEEVDPSSRLAPLYWYLKMRESVLKEEWDETIRLSAVMVARAAKNFDWLPVGLYWSLKGHLAHADPDVARTILKEMRLQFKDEKSTKMAARVLDAYPDFLEAYNPLGGGANGKYEGNPERRVEGFDGGKGAAVAFDGIDDEMAMDLDDDFNRFSIVFWFISENKNCGLISLENSEGSSVGELFFEHSNLHAYIDDERYARTKGGHFADGHWHQFAYLRGESEQVLYIDGFEIARSSIDGVEMQAATRIRLGVSAIAEQSFFEGRIDNLQLYGHALTHADVKRLFNRGDGGVRLDGLAAYFGLDDMPLAAIMSLEPEVEDGLSEENRIDEENNEKGNSDDEGA